MLYLVIAGAALCANLFPALGHLHRLRGLQRRRLTLAPPPSWPSVALLIPAKGATDPNLEANILAFLSLQYPGHLRILFCFESPNDPAVPIVARLCDDWARAQPCFAGLSTQCGQKNHNLLAGMAQAPDVDIYLLADVDILPPPSWARDMVQDLALDPHLSASTGYYYRIPKMGRGGVADHIAGIVAAWVSIGISFHSYPTFWGGSVAIRRSVAQTPAIRDRLAETVVDDMCLCEAFLAHGLRRSFIPSGVVPSYVDTDLKGLSHWAVRQTQYAQLHSRLLLPLICLTLLPAAFTLLAAPVALCVALSAGDPALMIGWLSLLSGWLLLSACFWRSTPHRDPSLPQLSKRRWALLTPLAFVMSIPVLIGVSQRRRGGAIEMRWRQITYLIDRVTARVLSITRS
jgi:ceramide glucosyltransferase